MRHLAVIPPMLFDAEQQRIKFINMNGLMDDPMKVYKDRQVMNVWSEQEKETFREKDRSGDTSGEEGEDKEPTVAFKGRRTANSQGRRKGRITRSMANENEEASAPQLSNELATNQRSHVTIPRILDWVNVERDQAFT
ncbi:Nuclear receptor corepressor 2 [Acipenser ruthenus]|uniref:Nuclear receptor corepressor 2 n=1 Tax=Acipenser ruthenus TaxID=7906 RepID=A0A444UUI1_ACIRT|nr:Nuclear receptor corepressor 2 [Acipenser ruthenus]